MRTNVVTDSGNPPDNRQYNWTLFGRGGAVTWTTVPGRYIWHITAINQTTLCGREGRNIARTRTGQTLAQIEALEWNRACVNCIRQAMNASIIT